MQRGGGARGHSFRRWRDASNDTHTSPIGTAAEAEAQVQADCPIDASFVAGGAQALPASAREKAENIVRAYGTHAHKWVWAPNASDARDLDPPTGWALTVSASAPVLRDAFSPRKMFYGTTAVLLPADTRFRDGTWLQDKERLRAAVERSKPELDRVVPQARGTRAPARLSMFDADGTGLESVRWNELLAGGGGAYAGLFSSTRRDVAGHVTDYWLVTQAGAPHASEDLYRLMEEVGARTTWRDFFLDNAHANFVSSVAERNRTRLLARVAEALQLDVHTDPDLLAFQGGPVVRRAPQLIQPTVQTLHHNVVAGAGKRTITLYSNTVDPASARAGILFGENPWLGPVLLRGPDTDTDDSECVAAGSAWHLDNAAVMAGAAFPTCTGRRGPVPPANNGAPGLPRSHPFVWEGAAVNRRLAPSTYRSRDPAFKGAEAKLGYNHAWPELDMHPVVVKVATMLSEDVLA